MPPAGDAPAGRRRYSVYYQSGLKPCPLPSNTARTGVRLGVHVTKVCPTTRTYLRRNKCAASAPCAATCCTRRSVSLFLRLSIRSRACCNIILRPRLSFPFCFFFCCTYSTTPASLFVAFFRVSVFFSYVLSFSFFPVSFFLAFFSYVVFRFSLIPCEVSGLLTCVCCACCIQHDGMTLHCLLPLLHYDVVFLCRRFVTTELVPL